MYKLNKPTKTTLKVNKSYPAETIEQKIDRIVNNNEPITDGAPLVYTNRADGVQPEFDIRTDRWEIATEAMDAVSKSIVAKREEQAKPIEKPKDQKPENKNDNIGGAEPIAGTDVKQ